MGLSSFTFVQWAHFRLCCSGYPQHAECLARANKDLDCFGVYPQMIVLSFYWTFSMDISPDFLYEVDRVFNQIHILFYGLSKHLYVAFLLLSSQISSKSSNVLFTCYLSHCCGFQQHGTDYKITCDLCVSVCVCVSERCSHGRNFDIIYGPIIAVHSSNNVNP